MMRCDNIELQRGRDMVLELQGARTRRARSVTIPAAIVPRRASPGRRSWRDRPPRRAGGSRPAPSRRAMRGAVFTARHAIFMASNEAEAQEVARLDCRHAFGCVDGD